MHTAGGCVLLVTRYAWFLYEWFGCLRYLLGYCIENETIVLNAMSAC